MTVKRLRIRNYQCHEDLKITFDPQITAIVGPSDVGKSSVLRALRWVATNRPLGDGFIRRGANKSSVKVWTDGQVVERARGQDNVYVVGGKRLEAMGSQVPEEVTSILRIDSVNFQGQHEPPFWFSLSPGEVAKQLNEIVDLTLIDQVLKNLSTSTRRTKEAVSIIEERIEAAKAELKSLDYVDDVNRELLDLEALQDAREHSQGQLESLQAIISKCEESKTRLDNLTRLTSIGEDLLEKGSRACQIVQKKSNLEQLLKKIGECKKEADRQIPDLDELTQLADTATKQRSRVKLLSDLLVKIEQTSTVYANLKSDVDELTDEVNEKCGGVCPICGSPWKAK